MRQVEIVLFWFLPSIIAFVSLALHWRQEKTTLDWTAVGSIATAISLFFVAGIVYLTNEGVNVSKDTERTRLTINLFADMESDREKRETVFKIPQELIDKPESWEENQRNAANAVVGRLNLAGLLIKYDKIQKSMFLDGAYLAV